MKRKRLYEGRVGRGGEWIISGVYRKRYVAVHGLIRNRRLHGEYNTGQSVGQNS